MIDTETIIVQRENGQENVFKRKEKKKKKKKKKIEV